MYFIEGEKGVLREEDHETALQQHAATFSTLLLFTVSIQIGIVGTVITTIPCCITHLLLYRAKDPKQDHLLSVCHVMFCIKLCCRASQTLPPFPQFMCSLCILKLWEKFQDASKELNEMWTKTSTIFTQSGIWRYYELVLCPERQCLLQLQAVWA